MTFNNIWNTVLHTDHQNTRRKWKKRKRQVCIHGPIFPPIIMHSRFAQCPLVARGAMTCHVMTCVFSHGHMNNLDVTSEHNFWQNVTFKWLWSQSQTNRHKARTTAHKDLGSSVNRFLIHVFQIWRNPGWPLTHLHALINTFGFSMVLFAQKKKKREKEQQRSILGGLVSGIRFGMHLSEATDLPRFLHPHFCSSSPVYSSSFRFLNAHTLT